MPPRPGLERGLVLRPALPSGRGSPGGPLGCCEGRPGTPTRHCGRSPRVSTRIHPALGFPAGGRSGPLRRVRRSRSSALEGVRAATPLTLPGQAGAAWAPHPHQTPIQLAEAGERAGGPVPPPFQTKPMTTLNNGYLGSRNDEERSEMRYVV